MDMKNKVVMVTGSSSGLGRATALAFAKEGASVVINSDINVSGGNEVVAEIKNNGGKAIYIQADVTKEDDVKNLFDTTIQKFGRLDILINNVGKTEGQPFLDSSPSHWLEQFQINFFSTVLCSQYAAKIMINNKSGAIINTSSIRGLDNGGREGIMAYSSSKAAIINFTKTLAKELAPDITVNAIAPGFVHTPPYDNFSNELKQSFTDATAIKRFIDEDEMANSYLFLAKNKAITGQVIIVDGGFSLKFT